MGVIATGRPPKIDLDWFPLDCYALSDPKLRRARQEYGYLAIVVYLELLCILYRDKGYYIEYNDQTRDDVIWTIRNDVLSGGKYEPTADTIRKLIDCLAACRLFSRDLYQAGFITSHRAQEQYYKRVKSRKDARINPSIWLLTEDEMRDISPSNPIYVNLFLNAKTELSAPETPLLAAEIQQNKEEKNNKEQSILNHCIENNISLRLFIERFEKLFGTIPSMGILSIARKRKEAGLTDEMLIDAVSIAYENLQKRPGADIQAYTCGVLKNYAPPAVPKPQPNPVAADWEEEWLENVKQYEEKRCAEDRKNGGCQEQEGNTE